MELFNKSLAEGANAAGKKLQQAPMAASARLEAGSSLQ